MTFTQICFSSRGRVSRLQYWTMFGFWNIGISILLTMCDIGLDTFDFETGIGAFSFIFAVISIIPNLFMYAKRLHDRNHPAWFLIWCFVPFVNLWILFEIFFLKGTTGNNEYGPDPLEFD